MKTGYLQLETGEVFEGELVGEEKEITGEVVFNTSMTGYQEMMTDPSYRGQILTFCYPLIGNYGINVKDDESDRPQVAGVIIGDMSETPSHYTSLKSLSEHFNDEKITGLVNVDTRAIVKAIRKHGTINGIITTQKVQVDEKLQQHVPRFLVKEVSTNEIRAYANDGPHVVLIDYGYKKSILQALLEEGCKVTVVPYHYSFEEIKALKPVGVLFSNGPGDPMDLKPWFQEIKKISQTYPTLGICLGHQLLALAYGARTEKLAYGHRGSNHPVKEVTTGKVQMTSQNHGYVVVKDTIDLDVFQVTFQNVNDRTVEGMKHLHYPIQAVQFHPEAHPGPSDTAYLFHDFIQQLTSVGEIPYAAM